jgi:hypothetical protein
VAPVTAGAGLGIMAALGASRFLESLLFGLSPRVDPLDALRAD